MLTPWYSPIRIISWQDAVKLKYEEVVDVVVEYPEEVRSPSVTWKIPAVVRLKALDKKDLKGIRYKWSVVLERDKFACQYCSKPVTRRTATRDHVHPQSKGGRTNYNNIVVACPKCNREKGNKTCAEWGKWPKKWPEAPLHIVFPQVLQAQENIPDEWRGFVREI